jgi:hypothetical protein
MDTKPLRKQNLLFSVPILSDNYICHFLLLLLHACGQSAELAMLI